MFPCTMQSSAKKSPVVDFTKSAWSLMKNRKRRGQNQPAQFKKLNLSDLQLHYTFETVIYKSFYQPA